jgi:hypothetical protein
MRLLILALALHSAPPVSAQDWQVIAANDPFLPSNGIPAGSAPDFVDVALADIGAGQMRGVLANSSGGLDGHWMRRDGSFVRFARANSAGALGPNRTGTEASDVFVGITQSGDDVGPDGQVTFIAVAGPPGSSTTASTGVWRTPAASLALANIEIMRYGTDGVLGPNLGAGWRFGALGSSYLRALSIEGSDVLIDAQTLSPTNQEASALVLHRPSLGNSTCALRGSTEAATGPGIGDASFQMTSGFFPRVANNEVYVQALIGGTSVGFREGYWRVCNGAPQALALTFDSGVLGPGTSVSGRFEALRDPPKPMNSGQIAFLASFRPDINASIINGVFRHAAGVNRLLAVDGSSSAEHGPNHAGGVFEALTPNNATLIAAKRHLALRTTMLKPGDVRVTGLWRLADATPATPVALIGESGAASPGGGLTFTSIGSYAVFDNGDIIAQCGTSAGTTGLYLFALGRAPRLLFAAGQSVNVITVNGPATATVLSYAVNDGATAPSRHASGGDDWAARDGQILVNATLSIPGRPSAIQTWLLARAVDVDLLFADGFEP